MDYSLDRGLPASPETERTILGSIVVDTRKPNVCLLQAQQRLRPDDFSLDSHRRIFSAMEQVASEGRPIEYPTIVDVLTQRKEVEACGGLGYVTDLADISKWPRLDSIDYYIDILLRHSGQRKIIFAASSAIQKAYELDYPEEIIGQLSDGLQSVSERTQADALLPVSKIMPAVAAEITAEFDRGADFIGLPTGIGRLNYALGGLVAGENIVIAADPGGGKTALALNIAEVNCLKDNPVSIFSLELSRKALLLRLAARRSGVPQWKIRLTAKLNHPEKLAILAELDEISRWPLWIDDTSGMTPRQLYSRGRMASSRGSKLHIVDFLQKIKAPGHTLREQVNCASETVRALAKDSKTPILNLSQLSRPAEKGHKGLQRKPTMFDLKESGNIEADAFVVILLWRDFAELDGKLRPTGNDAMIIGKNRNGPCDELPATFDAPLMQWRQRDEPGVHA